MKLADIIDVFIPGEWGNDTFCEDAPCEVSCIRGADIVPISNHEFDDIPKRFIAKRYFENKRLQVGDIVIEKSGGSPTQSTGRVVYISEDLLACKKDIVCSNFCVAFRVKPEWDSKYIYLYLQHIYNSGVFFNFEGKTSGIKNLQLDAAFSAIKLKKIAISHQRNIATILMKYNKKIAINREINRNLPLSA